MTQYIVTGRDTGNPSLPDDSVVAGLSIGATFSATLSGSVEAELVGAGLIARYPIPAVSLSQSAADGLYVHQDGTGLPALVVSRTSSFSQSGTLSVQAGQLRFRFPDARIIDSVAITVGAAPTGAAILVDVNKNGTTVFTTQANRPSIAISGNASTDAVPDVTAIAAGDYLTIDIDQIGSTAPGQDLVVTVKYH